MKIYLPDHAWVRYRKDGKPYYLIGNYYRGRHHLFWEYIYSDPDGRLFIETENVEIIEALCGVRVEEEM